MTQINTLAPPATGLGLVTAGSVALVAKGAHFTSANVIADAALAMAAGTTIGLGATAAAHHGTGPARQNDAFYGACICGALATAAVLARPGIHLGAGIGLGILGVTLGGELGVMAGSNGKSTGHSTRAGGNA